MCEPGGQHAPTVGVGGPGGERWSLPFACECGRRISIEVSLATETEAPEGSSSEEPATAAAGATHTLGLSAIEARVLALAAAGNTDREIARLLTISIHGVKHAIRSSLIRLGARNRTEAVVRALSGSMLQADVSIPPNSSNERASELDQRGSAAAG